MNESKLVERLRRHDEAALSDVIQTYTRLVSGVVYNLSGSRLSISDIEEITADTFAALWFNAEKVQEGCLKGYLLCIAKNKARDRLRKIKIDEDNDIENLDIISEMTVEGEIEEQMLSDALKDALDEIGEPDREIMIRHYYFCQSSTRIAEALEMKPKTVKTKILRAKDKLRKILTERGFTL